MTMPFRPSQALVTAATRIFLICGIGWFAALLVLWVTSCTSNPECHMINEFRAGVTFTVMSAIMAVSWAFMRVVSYHDFCAKVEAGIIKVKVPPRRPPREDIGHNASIPEALRVFNEGEKLNVWYLLGYSIAFVLIELIRVAGATPWLWIPALLCFGVPEIHGVMIRKHTLSQTIWIFQKTGSRFRKSVGIGIALWIPLVLLDASPGMTDQIKISGYPFPELLLLTSVLLWIVLGVGATVARAVQWKRPW